MREDCRSYTPSEILERVQMSYEEDCTSPNPFMGTIRGLYARDILLMNGQTENMEGYVQCLPRFYEKTFPSLVTGAIIKREIDSKKQGIPFERVRIVDLGYGKGIFLLDCDNKWKDKVELVGLGCEDYTRMDHSIVGYHVPPTYDQLMKAGVRLVEGNIIDCRRLLGDNFADFVVESNVLLHVNYPIWEMVKKVYRILKPGGIALLDSHSDGNRMMRKVRGYLREQGYDFEIDHGIAFRKTRPDIKLPIRTVNFGGYPTSLRISK
jgi:SAM-dependent methyltransferase